MIDWNDETVRVTDPNTGGTKDRKTAQFGALDGLSLYRVAQVAGHGAGKYGRLNWMRGYDWSLAYDAMQRHLLKWQAGEDTDPESGMSHLAHAAFHILSLIGMGERGLGTDDRYKEPERPTPTFTWPPSPETETSKPSFEYRAVCACGWQSDWTLDAGAARERWHDDHAEFGDGDCRLRHCEVRQVCA